MNRQMTKSILDALCATALALLVAIAFAAPTRTAEAQTRAELVKVTEVEGITQYELTSNGLKVLLYPDPSKATVTVNVTYLVGSRHEGRGEKGMAHLLEHMVFKGTPTYENIWGALQDHGARFNGTTWVDRTNYYETLPASTKNIDFALHMEADRMVNSFISGEELAKEMTVVRNEFEMGENNPQAILMQRIMSSAYLWHNYGDSTIGNRSDIERVPVENLRAFYRKYYQPDNAMLVVAGKFDVDHVNGRIVEYFGAIPRPSRVLSNTYTDEPTQDGPRHVLLQRVGSVGAVGAAYHTPAGPHADTPAIEVLSELLTDEPSGRLYKQLVESGKAVDIFGMHFQWAEPGVVLFMSQVRDDQDAEAALNSLTSVTESIKRNLFTEKDVERIRTKLLKNLKLAMTDSGRVGIQLSEWEAMGDWRMLFIHRDRLREVTADDVNRVATAYFVPSNRTTGIFVPTDAPMRAEIPDTPSIESIVGGYTGTEEMARGEEFEATPANIERRTIRDTLGDNIQVAMLSKQTQGDIVRGALIFRYGSEQTMNGHVTALGIMPELMMRGTERKSYQDIRDELNRIETQMSISGGPGAVQVQLTTMREHLPAALELLTEILREPSFSGDELEVIRKQQLAQLEEAKSQPMGLVFNAVQRALAPHKKGTIHYVPTIDEQIELMKAVTTDEIGTLYGTLVGASNLDAAFVGDFNPEQVKSLLVDSFGDWESGVAYVRVTTPYLPPKRMDETIDTPDKKNAIVAHATTLRMRDDDPYYPALDLANFVLGQSPKSRLLTTLRHEGGMSYGAGSFLQVDDQDQNAVLIGYAICNPANAVAAQQAMQREFEKWISGGVDDAELEEFRAGYLEGWKTRLASDQYIVGELADGLQLNRTFMYHQQVIDAVEGLTSGDIDAALSTYLNNATFVRFKGGDTGEFATGDDG